MATRFEELKKKARDEEKLTAAELMYIETLLTKKLKDGPNAKDPDGEDVYLVNGIDEFKVGGWEKLMRAKPQLEQHFGVTVLVMVHSDFKGDWAELVFYEPD